jgi:hypothetical protein
MKPNQYRGYCHQCSAWVNPGDGWLDGKDANGKWLTICASCASGSPVNHSPIRAPPVQVTDTDRSFKQDLLVELRGAVKRWYRQASMNTHPDRGGNAKEQAIVNECFHVLTGVFDAWDKPQAP